MSPFLCKKHGIQNLILTSPEIAKAVSNESQTLKNKIVLLKTESVENNNVYFVDDVFLKEFIPEIIEKEVHLKDRNKEKKELNDRLLILKILKKMSTACPECTKEALGRWEL